MYDFESARHAYNNDQVFRHLVEHMQMAIQQLHLTPADLRAAAHYACYLHEARNPPSTIVIGLPRKRPYTPRVRPLRNEPWPGDNTPPEHTEKG